MKIRTQLYLQSIISLALIGLLFIVNIVTDQAVERANQRLESAVAIEKGIFDLNILAHEYLIYHEGRAAAQWHATYDATARVIATVAVKDEPVISINKDFFAFGDLFSKIIDNHAEKKKLFQKEHSQEAIDHLSDLEVRITAQLLSKSQSVVASAGILRERGLAELAASRSRAALLRIIVLSILGLFSVITISVIVRGILISLRKLHEGAEVISGGNLGYRVELKRQDEIGQVAQAFNKMAAKLKESYSGLEEKIRERTAELSEAKAKDEAMLLSIGDGLVATDTEGKIVLVNKVFTKMLGWEESGVQGKLFTDVVISTDENGKRIPESVRPINVLLQERTKATTTTTTTTYFRRKDGTSFPVIITTSPIFIENDFIGAVEVFRNITKEKEIDKAKTEFVSLASHQLRTPLSTVNWYAEMVLGGDVGQITDKQKQYLEEIYHSNKRMVDLVNSLLNVSRIEMGTLAIEPKPTDIGKLADVVLHELKPQIEEHRLSVKKNYGQNLPKINVDPKLADIILQNLLSNSLNYTPDKGSIELSINKNGQDLLIQVKDTGIGIPKAQQSKIFSKLFRADNVRERGTDGTGLGLYVVKAVVEQFGGKIWFESEENKGTKFFVTLPLAGMKKKEGTKTLA